MADREKAGKAETPTPKQEAFALAFLETGNAAEAYRRAYDVPPDAKDGWIYVEACQLLDNPKVAQRLLQLRAEAERLSIFTLAAAMDEYEEARQLALKLGQPGAAVSATGGKAKLFGLDAPKRMRAEITGKDGGPLQIEDTGARDKLAALVARRLAATGPDGGSGGAD